MVTSSEGIENGLRAHIRFPPTAAPAPVGNVYTFALGELLSLDWSFDNVGNFLTVGPTSTLTFTNAAGGTVSYDALNLPGNDNAHFFSTGGQQNSLQLAWLNPILNYNANVNSTYFVDFTTTNALTQTATNRIVIQQGAGFSGAVPEPATWAMMIMGFGLTGAMMRRRPTVYA